MATVAEVLRYVNLLVLAALALAAARRWRSGAPGAGWIALALAALASLFSVRAVLGGIDALDEATFRIVAALAVLFPYLLFRFSAALAPAARGTEVAVAAATAAVLIATFAIPDFPFESEERPAWFAVYIGGLLTQWAIVLAVVSARLWRAGAGRATVARRRMRGLSFGSAALVVGVAIGAGSGDRPAAVDLVFRSLVLASSLAFFASFAPPRALRTIWRRPEEEHLRRVTQSLIGATEREEVVASVLPPMASIVGAPAVAIIDGEGRVLGTHGLPPAVAGRLSGAPPDTLADLPPIGAARPLPVPLARGSVVVWTSPFAPVFGDEEIELLRSLGAFAELAVERAELFAREREARLVLEQADELKSRFIALASHELRGPAVTVHGLAELLARRGDSMPADQQEEMRRVLHEESGRLVRLMEQLLDLSRLEAGVTEIRPEPVPLGERLEDLVRRVARERARDVVVDVPGALEAVVDPDALERVVSNLITNALRYAGPPIHVAAERRDSALHISVEDRGPGVSEEFRPRLFERFTRSESSAHAAGGTGLGLSIARSYAQAHGGDLLYRPAEPRGSRFELVLPGA